MLVIRFLQAIFLYKQHLEFRINKRPYANIYLDDPSYPPTFILLNNPTILPSPHPTPTPIPHQTCLSVRICYLDVLLTKR